MEDVCLRKSKSILKSLEHLPLFCVWAFVVALRGGSVAHRLSVSTPSLSVSTPYQNKELQ